MKSVLISIQPKWCELIANGKKTVEVRKTKPKLETPFKVYIYCTKHKRQWLRKVNNFVREIFITENRDVIGRTDKVKSLIGEYTTFVENGGYNGKVIGEFVCDKVENIAIRHFTVFGHENRYTAVGENPDYKWLEKSCLSYNEVVNYGKLADLYGWHISNLVIYDKPRELSEFVVEGDCLNGDCKKCKWFDGGNNYNVEADCLLPYDFHFNKTVKPLFRPPQSWCYVESEVQGE